MFFPVLSTIAIGFVGSAIQEPIDGPCRRALLGGIVGVFRAGVEEED